MFGWINEIMIGKMDESVFFKYYISYSAAVSSIVYFGTPYC